MSDRGRSVRGVNVDPGELGSPQHGGMTMEQIARGSLILQHERDANGNVTGARAGLYLGEDPDGTPIWAPFPNVEKIEPGDFETAAESFAGAVNGGPAIAPAGPTADEVAAAQAVIARANAAAGLEVQ